MVNAATRLSIRGVGGDWLRPGSSAAARNLAKDLKRSVAWRNSMMDKIVDSLFGKADAGIPAQQGEAGPYPAGNRNGGS